MNPSALIPVPDTLQVPWGWFQLLLLVTLFLHFVLMNVMLGTSVIALTRLIRNSGEDDPLTRQLSGKIPFAIAFTVNFGVAPLLFVQVLYGHLLYTSSVLMANFWILVIALLIIGYYAAYIFDHRYESLQAGRLLTMGVTVFTLLAVAFFMTNNFTMMQRPDSWTRYFDHPTGLLLNVGDPTFFPRYLHFITAAIAAGGLTIALFYEFRRRRGDEQAAVWIQYGCNWFAYATIVNFGIGFWLFGSLPKHVFDITSLNGMLIAVLLPAAIVMGVLSIIFSLQGQVMRVLYSAPLTIFIMILVRDLVRAAYLKPYFSVSDLKVVPQYSPMLLFLIVFAAGLVLVGWMLRLAWQSFNGREVQP